MKKKVTKKIVSKPQQSEETRIGSSERRHTSFIKAKKDYDPNLEDLKLSVLQIASAKPRSDLNFPNEATKQQSERLTHSQQFFFQFQFRYFPTFCIDTAKVCFLIQHKEVNYYYMRFSYLQVTHLIRFWQINNTDGLLGTVPKVLVKKVKSTIPSLQALNLGKIQLQLIVIFISLYRVKSVIGKVRFQSRGQLGKNQSLLSYLQTKGQNIFLHWENASFIHLSNYLYLADFKKYSKYLPKVIKHSQLKYFQQRHHDLPFPRVSFNTLAKKQTLLRTAVRQGKIKVCWIDLLNESERQVLDSLRLEVRTSQGVIGFQQMSLLELAIPYLDQIHIFLSLRKKTKIGLINWLATLLSKHDIIALNWRQTKKQEGSEPMKVLFFQSQYRVRLKVVEDQAACTDKKGNYTFIQQGFIVHLLRKKRSLIRISKNFVSYLPSQAVIHIYQSSCSFRGICQRSVDPLSLLRLQSQVQKMVQAEVSRLFILQSLNDLSVFKYLFSKEHHKSLCKIQQRTFLLNITRLKLLIPPYQSFLQVRLLKLGAKNIQYKMYLKGSLFRSELSASRICRDLSLVRKLNYLLPVFRHENSFIFNKCERQENSRQILLGLKIEKLFLHWKITHQQVVFLRPFFYVISIIFIQDLNQVNLLLYQTHSSNTFLAALSLVSQQINLFSIKWCLQACLSAKLIHRKQNLLIVGIFEKEYIFQMVKVSEIKQINGQPQLISVFLSSGSGPVVISLEGKSNNFLMLRIQNLNNKAVTVHKYDLNEVWIAYVIKIQRKLICNSSHTLNSNVISLIAKQLVVWFIRLVKAGFQQVSSVCRLTDISFKQMSIFLHKNRKEKFYFCYKSILHVVQLCEKEKLKVCFSFMANCHTVKTMTFTNLGRQNRRLQLVWIKRELQSFINIILFQASRKQRMYYQINA